MTTDRETPPSAQPQQSQNYELQLAANFLPFVGTLFNGIAVGTPGVPAEIVAKAFARACGQIVMASASGNLVDLIKLKGLLKESFEAGLGMAGPLRRQTPNGGAPG